MRADAQDEDPDFEPQPSAKPILEQARDLQTWSSAFPDSTDGWHISLEDLAICRDKSGRGIQLGGGASGKASHVSSLLLKISDAFACGWLL